MLLYKTVVGINKQLNKLITIPFPELEMGTNSVTKAGELMAAKGAQKVLIVTDAMIHSLGLTTALCNALKDQGIEYVIYDEVKPNPTIANVAVGADVYKEQQCNAIIAIGGGSPIDCAKAIGAKIVRDKPVRRLAGKLKIRKKLPPFMAIPTTAGTGSEATVAAVVSDPSAREKFAIVDPAILPDVALIDPTLMVGLPKSITAATGMDALTHAVESYIGTYHTPLTDKYAIQATEKIFKHLTTAFEDGHNLEAREQMAIASYEAGCAFTRAYVGYVHAFAHQLGGMYNIPHGLANAVLLPEVLKLLKPYCQNRLQLLAEAIGLNTAEDFIVAVTELNKTLEIPTSFPELKAEEIPQITRRALSEAHGTYPVPGYLTQAQGEALLTKFVTKE
ncbi:iron-containing alcohol dehydrogenase [Photobacterium rosenbergii]|uniref:Iron-containing alcohol dehydrogenase n=1 Tax=Photobacterium rosenbergii TaxID=294936 RepID=A0ABU3ZQ47_9GAMM|nr:iron-containing alcohol dehydrogenase [Photobacterium rosenbergii]MDV5172149.1 iron-containing alcohol dehydrogenase [Photobacterium rosenbergii]